MLPRLLDMPAPASLHTEFMAERRRSASSGRLLATGYSCRSQAKLVDGQALLHPAQALLACLRSR